ncbi:MAG: DUF1295 domain-containing protein [Planctomycetales bacterium]
MSPLWQLLLSNLLLVLLVLTILWIVSVVRRDASIIDPFWGLGFVLVIWNSVWRCAAPEPRVWLLAGLTTAWGLRLSLFLGWRNWGHGEDRRYAAMRAAHGRRFWWWSLFSVFFLQGVILWFVALPLQIATAENAANPLGWLDLAGFGIWLGGFAFETVGDWQLARFKADPRNAGKVLDRGLWRLTRHPNYFGDFCVWWGLYLIALSGGAAWTVGSPLVMSILLMKVSGVTLLEQTIVDRRPEYAAYQARTSAFFPALPRSGRRQHP